jgi:hypothetical protein
MLAASPSTQKKRRSGERGKAQICLIFWRMFARKLHKKLFNEREEKMFDKHKILCAFNRNGSRESFGERRHLVMSITHGMVDRVRLQLHFQCELDQLYDCYRWLDCVLKALIESFQSFSSFQSFFNGKSYISPLH